MATPVTVTTTTNGVRKSPGKISTLICSSGATGGTTTLYDNATAQSGNIIAQLVVPANMAPANLVGSGTNLEYINGISITLGTNVTLSMGVE